MSVRRVLPALDVEHNRALFAEIEARSAVPEDALIQDTDGVIREAAAALGPALGDATAASLRAAICLPAADLVRLYPGAHGLLATIRRLRMRRVLVTNVAVRDAEISGRDFAALGVLPFIDAIVTS